MRPANVNDLPLMDLIGRECGMDPLPPDVLDRCLGFVGDSGYLILDMQEFHTAIAHVVIAPEARGKWGLELLNAFFKWAFTATRIERINAVVPSAGKHIKRFAIEAGMRVIAETDAYCYLDINLVSWMSHSDDCLREGAHAGSEYPLADTEMVKRVTGACSLMHEAGMEHKAWYIYELYAKLFGYKVEV